MPRSYNIGDITNLDIEQVVITKTPEGVRIRANAIVNLVNALDPTEVHSLTIPMNVSVSELGVGPAVVAIRNAVIAYIKDRVK